MLAYELAARVHRNGFRVAFGWVSDGLVAFAAACGHEVPPRTTADLEAS